MAEASATLELSGVRVSYGVNPAVRGLSLSVGAGEFVALVGANGAGKTSLLTAIAGMKPYEGSIRLSGAEVSALAVDGLVRRGLALVPQGRLLFPRMSVRDNLRMGGYPVPRRQADERLKQLTSGIEVLSRRAHQLTRTMSGGEQQIVAVARALVSSPTMLMLDEPSLGLAPIMIRRVMDVVAEEHARGIGVLLAEQNLSVALDYADRIVVLRQGEVVAVQHRADGYDAPALSAAYLGGAHDG